MIGQAPFVGYTIADFAPQGEPEVSVDTSLVAASEEPEHFIAVASDRPLTLDSYAVVALPWQDVSAAAVPDPAILAEAEARVGAVEARAAEERAAAAARLTDLGAELARRDVRLKDTEARAGDSHVRAERLSSQIRDLEEELVRQRDRGTKLSKLLDEEKRARTKAELELGMVRNRPEIAGAKDRMDALASELEAARARIAELELEQPETRRRPVTMGGGPPAQPVSMGAAAVAALDRVVELEKAVDGALRAAADAAAERDALSVRARGAEAQIAALEADVRDARARVAESAEARAIVDAAAAEVTALEAALLDRGHRIAALTRDLHESERVGRELLAELEDRAAPRVEPTIASGSTGPDLRGRLDALAVTAARSEADLQAAAWRIAQLERELADARLAPEQTAVQLELEQALSAARDEVASLRRALSGAVSA
jgi:chromosome segregation ATPase